MKKANKLKIGIIATTAISCFALGWAFQGIETENAAAQAVTMKLDAIGNLEWNEVDGATGYNWTYKVGDTTSTTYTSEENTANVRTALKAAADAAVEANKANSGSVTPASVEFTVTPIVDGANGTAQTWTHTFTEYIDYEYTTHDIKDHMSVDETAMLSSSSNITNPILYKNDLLTFGVRSDITPLYQFSLGGSNGQGNCNYFMRLYVNGNTSWRVALGNNSFKNNAFGKPVTTRLEPNEYHYLSLAVFDTYNLSGETIGETVYLSASDYDYATDELVFLAEYKWFYSNEEIATETAEGKYYGWAETELANGQTVQAAPVYFGMYHSSSSPNTYIFSYNDAPALAKKTYTAYVMANNELLATKDDLKYGKPYDFTECIAAAKLDGYDINGLEMEFGGETINVPTTGTWTYDVESGIAIMQPVISPITYDITYEGVDSASHSNPNTYTIESDWTLAAPANISAGKVFAGWYEASDTDFSDPITTLKGKTGDMTLVARIVNGYTIVVEGQEYVWKEGDGAFVLTAPTVQGKVFVKWQVLSGSNYVDYTGETTFTPTAAMSFKAIYDWTTYTITYVAEGATHESAATYTAETPVSLSEAVKEGYFFLGWYKETTFDTYVSSTEGYTENLTLYAKFAENKLPAEIELGKNSAAQRLPVPQLPEGSQYTVELYKGTEKLELTDNAYVFDEVGTYTVKYKVVLFTEQTIEQEVPLTVSQFYTINVYYGDGEMIRLQKRAGEKLLETDFPSAPDTMTYEGVYTDNVYSNVFDLNTAISGNVNVYVKWTETTPPAENKPNGLGWLVPVIIGAVAVVAVACGVIFVLGKKKKR